MVMIKINIFEAKAKLSEYLERTANGEHIVICRHNKPVAELRPIDHARTEPRPIGPLAGRPVFDVPPSFFEPLPDEELDLWERGGAADPLSSSSPAPVRAAEQRSRYAARKRPRSRRS